MYKKEEKELEDLLHFTHKNKPYAEDHALGHRALDTGNVSNWSIIGSCCRPSSYRGLHQRSDLKAAGLRQLLSYFYPGFLLQKAQNLGYSRLVFRILSVVGVLDLL